MFQHVLHMLIYHRELRGRVATQLLKMRAAVTRINSVWNDIGATNIELGAGEYICTGANEFFGALLLLEGQIIGQAVQQTLNVVQWAFWRR